MSEARKPGYYWVRRWEGDASRSAWEVAEWRKAWWFIGCNTPFAEHQIESVGSRIVNDEGEAAISWEGYFLRGDHKSVEFITNVLSRSERIMQIAGGK